jgi:hypothetical protein
MHQMPPPPPNPPRIQTRTPRHRGPTPRRQPPELLRPTQNNSGDMLRQFEERDEGGLDAGEGGARVRGDERLG